MKTSGIAFGTADWSAVERTEHRHTQQFGEVRVSSKTGTGSRLIVGSAIKVSVHDRAFDAKSRDSVERIQSRLVI